MIVIGVDVHKASLTAVEVGRDVGEQTTADDAPAGTQYRNRIALPNNGVVRMSNVDLARGLGGAFAQGDDPTVVWGMDADIH